LRCYLEALDARETAEYIAGRIRVAGGNSVLVFTRQAVEAVFEGSGGIPRLISVICDNALISGFAADRRPVSRDIVDDVCRDFDLGVKKQEALPAPAVAAVVAPEALPAAAHAEGARPTPPAKALPGKSLFEHFTVRRRFSLF
jgi:hypothetical protein